MPKKRFSAEQIVVVLRQIEVLQSQGKSPPMACREAAGFLGMSVEILERGVRSPPSKPPQKGGPFDRVQTTNRYRCHIIAKAENRLTQCLLSY